MRQILLGRLGGVNVSTLCKVNGHQVVGIIDTAAEVTVMGRKVFQHLTGMPDPVRKLLLKGAGIGQTFHAVEIEPVEIEVEGVKVSQKIFVGDINDELLLGLDVLKKLGATIDVREGRLNCARKIEKGECWDKSQVIRLSEQLVIPANSEVVLPVRLEGLGKEDHMFFEAAKNIPVSIPRAVYKMSTDPVLCLVNGSDEEVRLNKGLKLGKFFGLEGKNMFLDDNWDRHVRKVGGGAVDGKVELPVELEKLAVEGGKNLGKEGKSRLRNLLYTYREAFATGDLDLGNFSGVVHTIDTGDAEPIKSPMRRTPLAFAREEDDMLESMLRAGVIRPSMSPWSSSPVLVRKKDGSIRWCIDFRGLNGVTRKDQFPIPHMDECIDALDGNIWFSKVDAANAYWQVPLDERSCEKTAFRTKKGLFEFTRLAFGLVNAPASFSRAMALILKGLNWKVALSFLDDVCILGRDEEEHFRNLESVLGRFRDAGLKLKPKKCSFFQKEIEYLGRRVGSWGRSLTDAAKETMKKWPRPECPREVSSFLGFANFHREFVKGFSEIAEPLFKLAKKAKGVRVVWVWGEEEERAFRTLCEKLSSAPVLAIPQRGEGAGRFILDTDCSATALGGVLSQEQGGKERVISFMSNVLTPAQRNYCASKREILAAYVCTEAYSVYLIDRKFLLRTDCVALTWLKTTHRRYRGQMARWMEHFNEYDFDIQHVPGKDHGRADALSRIPIKEWCEEYREGVDLSTLPCGGCPVCQQINQTWLDFSRTIDDVGRLADHGPGGCKDGEGSQVALIALPEGWDGGGVETAGTVRVVGGEEEMQKLPWWDQGEWQREQRRDPHVGPLYAKLAGRGKRQSEVELRLLSPLAKKYLENADLFFLSEGVLYWKDEVEVGRVVVPESLKQRVLSVGHESPLAGHMGGVKTLVRLATRFFWFGMSREVKDFVRGCASCNRNKSLPGDRTIHPRVSGQAGGFWRRSISTSWDLFRSQKGETP